MNGYFTIFKDEAPIGLIKTLRCCVCDASTKGRQWFNRDTGYGICSSCAASEKAKLLPEEMKSNYGIEGTHYFLNP